MMNKKQMNENLLRQFNVVGIDLREVAPMCNESLNNAVTINEELLNLGFTLKPFDIVRLSYTSVDTMDKVLDVVKSAVDKVAAKPMYPNFPSQVMEMDEAMFRMHQIMHYFSTYGVELLTGCKVSEGWLPSVEDTEKTESDLTLLKPVVIDLIDEATVGDFIIDKCFGKAERLTLPEMELVKYVVENGLAPGTLCTKNIKFKENLDIVFDHLFNNGDKNLDHYRFCQHTGDVLQCLKFQLVKHNMHFKTSQKKFFVKLLESYPVYDFAANVILTRSKAETNKILLRHISYNNFSRSAEHFEVVRQLRNNELQSWEGKLKKLIFSNDPQSVKIAAERPGMLLRYITLLYRNGISPFKIQMHLRSVADKLSTQTLVTLCNYFSKDINDCRLYNGEVRDNTELNVMRNILTCALESNLKSKRIPELFGKAVYVDNEGFDLEHSRIETNIKSIEGGYIPSGIAYKIPDDVKILRFFVYWNDRNRIDIDLHAAVFKDDNSRVNIGWCDSYRADSTKTCYSGDITHSNAAEYIDIDMDAEGYKYATTRINVYTRVSFASIEDCFTGMMAVNKLGEEVKLYDAKNCFYAHDLKGDYTQIDYAYIDIKNRCLVFVGKESGTPITYNSTTFSVSKYIELLLKANSASAVPNKEDADIVLSLRKSTDEKSISLIDNNYWMDYKN